MIYRYNHASGLIDFEMPGRVWFNLSPQDRKARTVFPSGKMVEAYYPNDEHGYRHDLLHSCLAVWQGAPYSLVLYDVAHGNPPTALHYEEESRVLAFQEYLRTGHRDEAALKPLIPLGLERLRDEALRLLVNP